MSTMSATRIVRHPPSFAQNWTYDSLIPFGGFLRTTLINFLQTCVSSKKMPSKVLT